MVHRIVGSHCVKLWYKAAICVMCSVIVIFYEIRYCRSVELRESDSEQFLFFLIIKSQEWTMRRDIVFNNLLYVSLIGCKAFCGCAQMYHVFKDEGWTHINQPFNMFTIHHCCVRSIFKSRGVSSGCFLNYTE